MPDQSQAAPQQCLLPKFMPALDGLRAFAVLGVLMLHFPYPIDRHVLFDTMHLTSIVKCGWTGVDLFFVISGFLITGILLDSQDSPHYFRNFYARRALRIWPLYYAVLIFVLVIYPLFHPSGSMVHETAPWFFYAFYLQNFITFGSRLLGVTWSLAVEEQFYVTWPFVIRAFSKKGFKKLIIVLLVAAPLIRLTTRQYVGNGFTFLPFCRMDGILAGSLVALWFRSGHASIAVLRKIGSGLLLVGGTASVVLLGTSASGGGNESILVYSFLAMAFSGLLCLTAIDSLLPQPFRVVLMNPWIRHIGKISYGIYLLHAIVFQACNFAIHKLRIPLERDTFWQDAICFVVELGSVILVASLSWHLLEQPLLRLKEKFEPKATNGEKRLRWRTAVSSP